MALATAPRPGARAARTGAGAKRKANLRGDKDGDLAMGSVAIRAKGGIAKDRPPKGPATRSQSIRPVQVQRQIAASLRQVSAGSLPNKLSSASRHEHIQVTGWANSKASTTSADGGVSSLISWLERKATLKSTNKRPVKIKKNKIEQDLLLVSVPSEHVGSILRLNGFEFAGKTIKVEKSEKPESETDETKENVFAMLQGVLARRYNPDLKLLDLSAMGQDPDLKAHAIFNNKSTTSKFFPAMMKVLEKQFATAAEKHEAIHSVTLAKNELFNLSAVTTLSITLPLLRNLDLSDNHFASTEDLSTWRTRFKQLDHLVVTNNPMEQKDANMAKTLISWFPRLRLLNSTQVRTDEEAAQASKVVDLPFPIGTAVFQDEGQIAENFIRTFFTGFDADRGTLARMYYDNQSTFSLALNTSAPRDPNDAGLNVPQEWDAYLKSSRNLKKITHPPARMTRLSRGVDRVIETWSQLPATRHPDLAVHAKKWLIECQLQPGLPDITGQSPGGVDGFLITIHGEFDEVEANTCQTKKKRSFDRTFLIGPGGPSGVRVVNDMLTIRAYGGTQAFEAADDNQASGTHQSALVEPVLPAGVTTEVAEQMVLELQKQTNMTVGYAKDCLEQGAWDFGRALASFAAVKDNLPPEAFVQGLRS